MGGATTLFATDADNREVLEYDGSGVAQRWYAFGLGPEAVLNQMNVPAATRTTLIPDIQGSIIGTLASGGTLSKSGYQPFGENPTVITGTYRYTAQRFDPRPPAARRNPPASTTTAPGTIPPPGAAFCNPIRSAMPGATTSMPMSAMIR